MKGKPHPLAVELWEILRSTHAPWGEEIEPGEGGDFEYHRVGDRGVLAFTGPYLLVAWPEGADVSRCTRDAIRLIGARLRTGPLRSMVHHRNFRSIKATRRLGATLLGVDPDGYFHYSLTAEGFRYGQEVQTPQGA